MRTDVFLVALTLAATTGCLRKTEYKCADSAQCGTDGVCEPDTGFCSFSDSECTSGRRYGEYSGTTFSGRCVGDENNPDVDASVDIDSSMMEDGGMGNCPATYTVAGATRRYRVITAAATWNAQMTDCGDDTAGTNTYLAVPGDQTELTAILTAANVAQVWVGISDTVEGTYATTAGGSFAQNDPLWDAGEPNDNPFSGGGMADCVAGVQATGQVADTSCNETYAAVCECEP